jgi:hypothetical protein
MVGKLNGAIVRRSMTRKRTLISRMAPPNPQMQPTGRSALRSARAAPSLHAIKEA